MITQSGFKSKISIAFVATGVVVLGLAIGTWKLSKDADTAAKWVSHAQAVINMLAQVNLDTLNVELSTQNFRISGDTSLLVRRDAIIAQRDAQLNTLQETIADNPVQLGNLMRLIRILGERVAISRQVVVLRNTQGLEAASDFVKSSKLIETGEQVYALLDEMRTGELRLFEERYTQQQQVRQKLLLVEVLLVILLLVLLLATYILISRQIRAIARSQRALSDNENDLAITLQSIGDAVMATDATGHITRMNPVAERLTGWLFAEARGKHIHEVFNIIHEETRAPAVVPVARVIETGEIQGLANHTVIIAKNGQEYPIADSAAPIRDSDGHIRGAVLVFRDVTDEYQAQHTIREQNNLLEQRVEERAAQLLESQEHLNSVINNVPALIAYVDTRQRYVYVNRHYRERFAPGRTDITDCTVQEILGHERYAIAQPVIETALSGESCSYDWEPFPGVWQAMNYMPKLDSAGSIAGYYVLGTDITDRKISESKVQDLNTALELHIQELSHVSRALKSLNATNRAQLRAPSEDALLENICKAIVDEGGYKMVVVWYRAHDATRSLYPAAQYGCAGGIGILRELSQKWSPTEGGNMANAVCIRSGQTSSAMDMANDPNYAQWQPFMLDCASVVACPLYLGGEIIGALSVYASEPHAFHPDEEALLTQSANDLAFGISSLRTLEEQQKTQEAIRHMTHFDALTDLPNEILFTETLVSEIESSQKLGMVFAVIQVNIKRLSEINLAFGFSYGDQILREFGKRIKSALPGIAVVSRLRGDEFAALLPNCDKNSAISAVQRLEETLSTPFSIGDISLDVSARVGVAIFPEHGSTAQDLLRNVDRAVKQAQKAGSEHVMYDSIYHQDNTQRLVMAGELRRGIAAGDLRLYLQPKVVISTGRVCGAEALVRWEHPVRGMIQPGEFISLAEYSGLIDSITEWVIETTLHEMAAWKKNALVLPISVNLSARNFHDEHLLEKIRLALLHDGIEPGLLELEITESVAMEDPELALTVLHGLNDQGITLSIDDFGTGYSSLTYLQKLPVQYIKIDQSFVREMSSSPQSAMIVRSTIDLVHELGLKTVAEGVETREDWDQLAKFGCDIAQGYFIARPMPAQNFQSWLANYHTPHTSVALQT